jgi:hypothetical protein
MESSSYLQSIWAGTVFIEEEHEGEEDEVCCFP